MISIIITIDMVFIIMVSILFLTVFITFTKQYGVTNLQHIY